MFVFFLDFMQRAYRLWYCESPLSGFDGEYSLSFIRLMLLTFDGIEGLNLFYLLITVLLYSCSPFRIL